MSTPGRGITIATMRRRCGTVLLTSVSVAFASCGDGPTTALTPTPDSTKKVVSVVDTTKGAYVLVPVDSPSMSLKEVGITPSGVVGGTIFTGLAFPTGFLWKDGVFTLLGVAGTPVNVAAMNDSSDLIGDLGPNKPFIWYAGDAVPTRLFPFDTAVTAIDINNQREVLLSPTLEYFPGASVWHGGEVRRLVTTVPVTPKTITNNGQVIATVRGLLTNRWVRLPSPFLPPPTLPAPSATCAPFRESVPILADHNGRVLVSMAAGSGSSITPLTVIDDGQGCPSAVGMIPGFTISGFSASGWFWGVADSTAAITQGGKIWSIKNLLNIAPSDVVWLNFGILTVNRNGFVLGHALKFSGFGKGKTAPILLRPK